MSDVRMPECSAIVMRDRWSTVIALPWRELRERMRGEGTWVDLPRVTRETDGPVEVGPVSVRRSEVVRVTEAVAVTHDELLDTMNAVRAARAAMPELFAEDEK